MKQKKFKDTFTAKILVFLKKVKLISKDRYAELRNYKCIKYYDL